MIPLNGRYEWLKTDKFSDGTSTVPLKATHFIISAHRNAGGGNQSALNHAIVKIKRTGSLDVGFDCLVPSGEFITNLDNFIPGTTQITYATGNTEPEIISFYRFTST
jgi:hypothetical protein